MKNKNTYISLKWNHCNEGKDVNSLKHNELLKQHDHACYRGSDTSLAVMPLITGYMIDPLFNPCELKILLNQLWFGSSKPDLGSRPKIVQSNKDISQRSIISGMKCHTNSQM